MVDFGRDSALDNHTLNEKAEALVELDRFFGFVFHQNLMPLVLEAMESSHFPLLVEMAKNLSNTGLLTSGRYLKSLPPAHYELFKEWKHEISAIDHVFKRARKAKRSVSGVPADEFVQFRLNLIGSPEKVELAVASLAELSSTNA